MRRFSSILLVPFTLLFSLAASYLMLAVTGKKESPPDPPLGQYRNLFRNYRLFNEFLALNTTTRTTPVTPEELASFNGPPFINQLLTLKLATTQLQEKDETGLQQTLLAMSTDHPYLMEKHRKLHLRYLYTQKDYREFIRQCEIHPPNSLETRLLLLFSYFKSGNINATHTLLEELFPSQPVEVLEKYIGRAPLNQFLKQITADSWFKKLQYLARANRARAFQTEKKYVPHPQMITLFQAELDYNSKEYKRSKKQLDQVKDESLLPYKKYLLLKIQIRDNQYTTLFVTLAELESETTLYPQALTDCANILMIDGERDLAIQLFSRYIASIKAMAITLNGHFNLNLPLQDENYWKTVWLCAWLAYQKKDLPLATVFFREGVHATDDAYKIASQYWLKRIAPAEAMALNINLEEVPFSFYYTRENPDSKSLSRSVQVFADLLNHPRSAELNDFIALLRTLTHYDLLADACDLIQWTLQANTFGESDAHVLKILQSILYLKQDNENMAFNRFRKNFKNYAAFLLPRFLRQIVMPLKYGDIIEKNATEQGIESAWLYSLIREESFFRASVTSYADAHGLMQLLLPTARQMASTLNLQIAQADLFNPEVNIRLGTLYLRYLLDKYNGKFHLALAAYNAGDFRVDKWLERFGQVTDDEFIEMIPFTATRTYVKHIMRNYYFYNYYYGKEQN